MTHRECIILGSGHELIRRIRTTGVMNMTERESAHPGGYEIPPELVTTNNDEKSRNFNENCVPKQVLPLKQITRETRWVPTAEWVKSWKDKLPLQTIMRLLQVLVPQVEKICIDK